MPENPDRFVLHIAAEFQHLNLDKILMPDVNETHLKLSQVPPDQLLQDLNQRELRHLQLLVFA
jgi:hypothetical protein